jgi:hypothetical protein
MTSSHRSHSPENPVSTPQTRLSAPASAAAKLAPLGKTQLRGTAWGVPGREPGQTRNLRHLTWSGPGDYVRLCYGGIADGGMEYPGEDMGRASGRCPTFKQARAAVNAYVSGWRI